jgi:F420-non-reducing hydrogenase iron-sulfur subunit
VKCKKVVEDTLKVLRLLGVDERYLHLKWISASEGAIFAEEVRSFTRLLTELGKNPLAVRDGSASEPKQEAA